MLQALQFVQLNGASLPHVFLSKLLRGKRECNAKTFVDPDLTDLWGSADRKVRYGQSDRKYFSEDAASASA